jgi:hypothetical protein
VKMQNEANVNLGDSHDETSRSCSLRAHRGPSWSVNPSKLQRFMERARNVKQTQLPKRQKESSSNPPRSRRVFVAFRCALETPRGHGGYARGN